MNVSDSPPPRQGELYSEWRIIAWPTIPQIVRFDGCYDPADLLLCRWKCLPPGGARLWNAAASLLGAKKQPPTKALVYLPFLHKKARLKRSRALDLAKLLEKLELWEIRSRKHNWWVIGLAVLELHPRYEEMLADADPSAGERACLEKRRKYVDECIRDAVEKHRGTNGPPARRSSEPDQAPSGNRTGEPAAGPKIGHQIPETVRKSDAGRPEIGHDNNKEKNTSVNNNTDPVAVLSPLEEENAEVLRRIGVWDKTANELCAREGLTPLGIALLARTARTTGPKAVQNLAGWLATCVSAGATGPQTGWGPEQVSEVIKKAWLRELDGHPLDGAHVAHNTDAVFLYRNKADKQAHQNHFAELRVGRLRELAEGGAVPDSAAADGTTAPNGAAEA